MEVHECKCFTIATQAQYYMLLHFKKSAIHNLKQVCMRLYARGINVFLLWYKRLYFDKCLVFFQWKSEESNVLDPIDFLVRTQTFFKISFVFCRRNKLIQVWNNMPLRLSKSKALEWWHGYGVYEKKHLLWIEHNRIYNYWIIIAALSNIAISVLFWLIVQPPLFI